MSNTLETSHDAALLAHLRQAETQEAIERAVIQMEMGLASCAPSIADSKMARDWKADIDALRGLLLEEP